MNTMNKVAPWGPCIRTGRGATAASPPAFSARTSSNAVSAPRLGVPTLTTSLLRRLGADLRPALPRVTRPATHPQDELMSMISATIDANNAAHRLLAVTTEEGVRELPRSALASTPQPSPRDARLRRGRATARTDRPHVSAASPAAARRLPPRPPGRARCVHERVLSAVRRGARVHDAGRVRHALRGLPAHEEHQGARPPPARTRTRRAFRPPIRVGLLGLVDAIPQAAGTGAHGI